MSFSWNCWWFSFLCVLLFCRTNSSVQALFWKHDLASDRWLMKGSRKGWEENWIYIHHFMKIPPKSDFILKTLHGGFTLNIFTFSWNDPCAEWGTIICCTTVHLSLLKTFGSTPQWQDSPKLALFCHLTKTRYIKYWSQPFCLNTLSVVGFCFCKMLREVVIFCGCFEKWKMQDLKNVAYMISMMW